MTAAVRVRADFELVRLGMSDELRAHVSGLGIYPRVPYVCAAWLPSASQRCAIAEALCLHAIGLKLLDDIVDGDQPLSPRELVTGHVLCQLAEEDFAEACGGRLTAHFARDWVPGWRRVLSEPLTTIRSVDAWAACSEEKSLLGQYAVSVYESSARAEDAPAIARAVVTMAAIGQIIDDFKDFASRGEIVNNLAALLADGVVEPSEARTLLNSWNERVQAVFAMHPPLVSVALFHEALVARSARCLDECAIPLFERDGLRLTGCR